MLRLRIILYLDLFIQCERNQKWIIQNIAVLRPLGSKLNSLNGLYDADIYYILHSTLLLLHNDDNSNCVVAKAHFVPLDETLYLYYSYYRLSGLDGHGRESLNHWDTTTHTDTYTHICPQRTNMQFGWPTSYFIISYLA